MERLLATESSDQRRRIWWIPALLLLASAINYMDRQTLAAASVRVTKEFRLTGEQYGRVEARFATAFAVGSLFFGILADRFSVRWLYPSALLAWSFVGFATGWARDYEQLLFCRGALGFFEAAHWPCALKTTQLLLASRGRALGNGVLQSGTSIGAIITPVIMWWIMVQQGWSWRVGFQLVGTIGMFWILGWLLVTRAADFQPAARRSSDNDIGSKDASWHRGWLDQDVLRRIMVILVAISLINTSWQLLRAWLPKILQQQVGYTESQTLWFSALWFVFTDLGCIGAGYLAYRLAKTGSSVRASRLIAFAICAACCASMALVPSLSKGFGLLVVLLISGAGALGVFPLYYAFTQDISRRRIGLITGVAGAVGWLVSSKFQVLFGRWSDLHGSFDQGIYLASILPILALINFAVFWPHREFESAAAETSP